MTRSLIPIVTKSLVLWPPERTVPETPRQYIIVSFSTLTSSGYPTRYFRDKDTIKTGRKPLGGHRGPQCVNLVKLSKTKDLKQKVHKNNTKSKELMWNLNFEISISISPLYRNSRQTMFAGTRLRQAWHEFEAELEMELHSI